MAVTSCLESKARQVQTSGKRSQHNLNSPYGKGHNARTNKKNQAHNSKKALQAKTKLASKNGKTNKENANTNFERHIEEFEQNPLNWETKVKKWRKNLMIASLITSLKYCICMHVYTYCTGITTLIQASV